MTKNGDLAGQKGQDPTFVQGAFAKIASRYVLTNHVLSFGIDILWRRFTAAKVQTLAPNSLLDLATGSGDLAIEILKKNPSLKVLGADFSAPMIREAQKAGLPNLMVADAMALPVKDSSFDAVSVAFGLRNMANWSHAIQEMHRVIRPGGHLFVLDFSLPTQTWMRKFHLFYLRHVMPSIAGWLTGEKLAYQYLCGSIEKFPCGQAMNQLLEENGFTQTQHYPLTFGIATLYIAKK